MDDNNPISILAKEFSKLPGVGSKSALRMAYFYVYNKQNIKSLSNALSLVDMNIDNCIICNMIVDKKENPCKFCRDENRNKLSICILENSTDIDYIEKSGVYKGVYHILGGVISPLNNSSYSDKSLDNLKKRLNLNDKFEIIIATNFTTEGEATGSFIRSYLSGFKNIKFSRLASGLPVGSNLEYIDTYTIGKALERRIDYDN